MKIINILNIKYVESFEKEYDKRYTYNEHNNTFNFSGCNTENDYDINIERDSPHLMVEENKVYTRPQLVITYSNDSSDRLLFSNIEDAEKYARESLCNHAAFKELK